MAEYKIECEQCLGISHSGAVYTSGESTVELSDEEVATLVRLIREKNTTDGAGSPSNTTRMNTLMMTNSLMRSRWDTPNLMPSAAGSMTT